MHGTDLTESYASSNYTIKVRATLELEYSESYEVPFTLMVKKIGVTEPEIIVEEPVVAEPTNTGNHPSWYGETLENLEAEPFESGKPIPYVASLSEAGLLTIGWDNWMVV